MPLSPNNSLIPNHNSLSLVRTEPDQQLVRAKLKQRRLGRACDQCNKKGIKCSPKGPDGRCDTCRGWEEDEACTWNRPAKKRGAQAKPKEERILHQKRYKGKDAKQEMQQVTSGGSSSTATEDQASNSHSAEEEIQKSNTTENPDTKFHQTITKYVVGKAFQGYTHEQKVQNIEALLVICAYLGDEVAFNDAMRRTFPNFPPTQLDSGVAANGPTLPGLSSPMDSGLLPDSALLPSFNAGLENQSSDSGLSMDPDPYTDLTSGGTRKSSDFAYDSVANVLSHQEYPLSFPTANEDKDPISITAWLQDTRKVEMYPEEPDM